MEDWEVAARVEIMDLVARYTRAGDTGRGRELAALFAEDGEYEIDGPREATGRAEIERLIEEVKVDFAAAPSGFAPARHHVSSLTIDFDDAEHARGRAYFLLVGGWGPDHWGIYRDRYVRVEGRWYFAHRTARMEAAVSQSPVAHRLP